MSSHDSRLQMIASAAAIGIAVAVWVAPAKLCAADLGPSLFSNQPSTQIQPVEFGTGWYIRGDLAYARNSLPPLSSGLSQSLSSATTSGYSADLGFGYKFTNWFRADFIGEYRDPITSAGTGTGATCITALYGTPPTSQTTDTCTPHYASSVRRWDFLGNGYFDIGTWSGFTPYVGAGAGFSLTTTASSTNWYMSNGVAYHVTTDGFYFNWDQSSSTLRYQFAWALMAGVSYAVTPQFLIDLGYRYINLGTLPGIANSSGQVVTMPMNAQEIRIGLRYMID